MARKALAVGKQYGQLVVVSAGELVYYGREGKFQTSSVCRCSCGVLVQVRNSSLKNGHTQSCGCLQRGSRRLPEGEASDRAALYKIKVGATRRGLEWSIPDIAVREYMSQPCRYCGRSRVNQHAAAHRDKFNGTNGYNGLDRVDNTRGYTADNVVPCCGPCNRLKSNWPVEDFLELVGLIARHACSQKREI